MKDFYKYKKEDIVQIICPLSPCDNKIGVISKADNKLLRYEVEFKDYKDTFWYHQITPHRPKESLEALIDLSLALGPAAKHMFEDWVMEYQLRFPKNK